MRLALCLKDPASTLHALHHHPRKPPHLKAVPMDMQPEILPPQVKAEMGLG